MVVGDKLCLLLISEITYSRRIPGIVLGADAAEVTLSTVLSCGNVCRDDACRGSESPMCGPEKVVELYKLAYEVDLTGVLPFQLRRE